MIKLLKKIISIFFKFKNCIAIFIGMIFNFFYPNVYNLSLKRITFKSVPKCSQLTICEGSGIVRIGKGCSFGFKLGGFHRCGSIELQARYKNSKIVIGNYVATNNNIVICAANYIEIGNNTLIGQYVTILDHEAHGIHPDKRRQIGDIGHVIIGNNTWLGNNVIILKNTEIGDNSIVAAGAVVSGKFPANVIIGGVPAKIIRNL